MPKIPQFESEGNIRVGAPPRINAPEMGMGAISRSERAQAGVVNAIEGAEDMLIKVRDFRQMNEASVYHSEKTRELETLVKQDPDIEPDKYATELDKITNDASKTISGQLAKEEFMTRAKQHNIVINYGIKDLYRSQQIEGAKSIIVLKGEQLATGAGDMTDIQLHSAVADWKTSLNDAIKKGVYNKAEADLIDLKVQEKMRESGVDTAIANEQAKETKNSIVLSELNKGKDGIFAGLNSEQRATAIKKARLKINDNKQAATEAKVDNRFDYVNQIATGKLNWQNSEETIKAIADHDPELAEAMQKVVDSQGQYFPEQADNEAFANLVNNIFTSGTKEEVSDFLVEALNSSANKEMSKDRLAILVNAAQERTKSLPVNENAEPPTLNPKQNEIDAGVKSIIKNDNKQFNVGDMIVNFFKSLAGGKTPQDAHNEAVKSEVNRTNPLSVAHKIDDVITLPDGRLFQVTGFTTTGSPKGKVISGKRNSNIK